MDSDIVLMKEGRWSLVKEGGKKAKWNLHSSILHYCSNDSLGFYTHYLIKRQPLGSYLSVSDSPTWICIGCGNIPPESLLTVFILHNWDDCSDEMTMGRRIN